MAARSGFGGEMMLIDAEVKIRLGENDGWKRLGFG